MTSPGTTMLPKKADSAARTTSSKAKRNHTADSSAPPQGLPIPIEELPPAPPPAAPPEPVEAPAVAETPPLSAPPDPSKLRSIPDFDIYLFNVGEHRRAHQLLGAHLAEGGVRFAVWAPNA